MLLRRRRAAAEPHVASPSSGPGDSPTTTTSSASCRTSSSSRIPTPAYTGLSPELHGPTPISGAPNLLDRGAVRPAPGRHAGARHFRSLEPWRPQRPWTMSRPPELGTGIFGASYSAAAGLYKNLGYLPTGYDGIDNNGNGQIDEWAEGVATAELQRRSAWYDRAGNLDAHQHNTRGRRCSTPSWSRARARWARSSARRLHRPGGEGHRRRRPARVRRRLGPAAPVLPLAVALPLRHPARAGDRLLGLHADASRCRAVELFNPPYRSVFEHREQDPLDPNQQLVAPAWWSSTATANSQLAVRRTAPTAAAGLGRRQRRGRSLRVLLPPAHRAVPEHRQRRGSTGTGTGRLVSVPQGLLHQAPDRLCGTRPATGSLPLPPGP